MSAILPIYYLTCAHEQRAHGLQSIGVAIKNTVFVTSFSPILTDSSYLRVAQMPRCGDLVIFVTPCACVQGNNNNYDDT